MHVSTPGLEVGVFSFVPSANGCVGGSGSHHLEGQPGGTGKLAPRGRGPGPRIGHHGTTQPTILEQAELLIQRTLRYGTEASSL